MTPHLCVSPLQPVGEVSAPAAACILLIEKIFSLDGLGLLSYESVINRDFPVVMGSLFIFSLIHLVMQLITDICYVIVDPRITFEEAH